MALVTNPLLDTLPSLEFNPLCEGEFLGVVDGAGGPPHVLLPRIAAALSASPGGLVAPKGPPNLGPIGGYVDVYNTAVRTLGAQPLKQGRSR